MAIYKGLEATLHEAFWGDRGSDLEVQDIKRLFPSFTGRALEIGAGSGRILRPLAEAGWEIEGIEPSTEMVEMYNESQKEAPIHLSTLEEFSADQKYDLILLTSYVFQLFEEPASVFESLNQLLTKNGKIYISLMIPWAEIVGELAEGEWLLDDEIKLPTNQKARCWVNFDLDRIRQRLTRQHRYEILEKKKIINSTKTEQKLRWYTLPEFEHLVEKHGYKVLATSYEFKDGYDSDAHSMGLVLGR